MIANLTDVYRSIAVSAALTLSGFDPVTEFAEYDDLPRAHRRPYVTYRGQDFPLTFGPYGTAIKPGICVEVGKAASWRERYEQTVIVCIYRKIVKAWEYEQVMLNEMIGLLNPWINQERCSPVFSFGVEDTIDAIVGNCYWAQRGLPPVLETPVGTPSSAYIGYEFEFLMRFGRNFETTASPEPPEILLGDDDEVLLT